jgi:predicted ATP-dependent endonuclease of OLD family
MTNNSTIDIDSPQTIAIRIQRVAISGFRGIDQMELELDEATTYLVGENNSGKTSVLLALWTALGARRPMVDDLRRDVNGVVATEASIDIFVIPREGEVFADDVRQRLLSVQRDPTSGVETVGFRVTLLPSQEGMFLSLRRTFLQPGADGVWIVAPTPTLQPQN